MPKGIDVSVHNGGIDQKKEEASGVEFAIIRAGFGCTTDKSFAVLSRRRTVTILPHRKKTVTIIKYHAAVNVTVF